LFFVFLPKNIKTEENVVVKFATKKENTVYT